MTTPAPMRLALDMATMAMCRDAADAAAIAQLCHMAEEADGQPFALTNVQAALVWGLPPSSAARRLRRFVDAGGITIVDPGGDNRPRRIQLPGLVRSEHADTPGFVCFDATPAEQAAKRQGDHKYRSKAMVRVPDRLTRYLSTLPPEEMMEVVHDLVHARSGRSARVTAAVGTTSDTRRLRWLAYVRAWVPPGEPPMVLGSELTRSVYRDAVGSSATRAAALLVRELFTPGTVTLEEKHRGRVTLRRVRHPPLLENDETGRRVVAYVINERRKR